jgi:hypothetical protein
VVIWVDSFSDMLGDCDLGAVVAVLADAGYQPEVLTDDVCCGLTWITTGQLDGAIKKLRKALDVLGPLAEAGIPIVGLEPSCTTVWRTDALELVGDDPRTETVAKNVHTMAEMLEAAGWRPPSLAGHTIVAQPHCHHASILGFGPDQRLLEASGATVKTVGGCCGYAGNFGVEIGHYETSGSRLPSTTCFPLSGRPGRPRSSWPTGSPAGVRPPIWRDDGRSPSQSCSRRTFPEWGATTPPQPPRSGDSARGCGPLRRPLSAPSGDDSLATLVSPVCVVVPITPNTP